MPVESMPPGQAILENLDRANSHLAQADGVRAEVAAVHVSMAQMFATCALVSAVQELTNEVRKLNR
jgi:hypothetical protein